MPVQRLYRTVRYWETGFDLNFITLGFTILVFLLNLAVVMDPSSLEHRSKSKTPNKDGLLLFWDEQGFSDTGDIADEAEVVWEADDKRKSELWAHDFHHL